MAGESDAYFPNTVISGVTKQFGSVTEFVYFLASLDVATPIGRVRQPMPPVAAETAQ